jgi:23S rRNA (uracil1939-C5)-methyltransferase
MSGSRRHPARKPAPPARRETTPTVADVVIEAMAGGGSGIGHIGRRTVFVPYTIPGERVQVRLTGERDGELTGEGITLLEASADRVYPACDGFLREGCVRCGWQHIAYAAQPLLKQDLLAEHLERVGRAHDAPVLPTIAAIQPWRYLQHATWSVDADGRLKLPGRGGGLVRSRDCALIDERLLALLDQLDADAEAWEGVSKVRLQQGSDGALMVQLTATADAAPELETDFDVSVNLILPDNEPVNLIGSSFSTFDVGGIALRATAGAAFRANVSMIPALVEAALRGLDLKRSDRTLDLYAGVGVFSAHMAPLVSHVTLVESYPPAVTDADENLAAFEHVDVIEGGVETVLPELDGPCHAAVVDAPRGLTSAVITQLERLGVQRLALISDDAATGARDVRTLLARGWALHSAQAVDLMPQTPFVDSVLCLRRDA